MHPATGLPSAPGVVLVVEDSRFDQERMVRILRAAGVGLPVVVAGTIAQAEAALVRHRVVLAILDNALPDGLGVNLALALAADPTLRAIPVALVTDWPTPFMHDKARLARVRAVIPKSDFGPDIAQRLVA
jgi:CheY-like chemotaxis protein